jgi:hypothetical protein
MFCCRPNQLGKKQDAATDAAGTQMMQTSGGAEYAPRSVAAACKSSFAVFEKGMVLNGKVERARGGGGSRDRTIEELISPQQWSCEWKNDP